MAQVIGPNQVKLNDGRVVQAQQGGWYDAQQFWGGTLSAPGVINQQSNQVGAGQAVSSEVLSQTDTQQNQAKGTNEAYINSLRQQGLQAQQASLNAGQAGSMSSSGISGSGSGAGIAGLQTPQPIDLSATYKSLYDEAGISDLESQLIEKNKELTEAMGVVNDNPYLSEATRVGRIAKLEELHQNRTKNLIDEIAMKKADVETKLNLQLKQLDINSEATQQAWNQFNTLLSMGALDNASGTEIAQFTTMTGIPSTLIQSAINANKKKNQQTQVISSTDDNGVVTISVVDPTTGNLINQTSLGAIGNKQGSSSSSNKINEVEVKAELVNKVREGYGVRDVFAGFSDLLDPDDILRIYNANSPHGGAKESAEELSRLGVNVDKFGMQSNNLF